MLTHNPIHHLCSIIFHCRCVIPLAYLGILVDDEVDVAVLDGARRSELADGPLELLDNVLVEGRGDLDVVSSDGDGDGLGGHAEGAGPAVDEAGLLRGKCNGGTDQGGSDGGSEAHGCIGLDCSGRFLDL